MRRLPPLRDSTVEGGGRLHNPQPLPNVRPPCRRASSLTARRTLPYNGRDMESQTLQFVEIVNRLKRGTLDGRVLWEKTGSYGHQFAAALDAGHRALVANIAPPGGGQSGVLFTMTNAEG